MVSTPSGEEMGRRWFVAGTANRKLPSPVGPEGKNHACKHLRPCVRLLPSPLSFPGRCKVFPIAMGVNSMLEPKMDRQPQLCMNLVNKCLTLLLAPAQTPYGVT